MRQRVFEHMRTAKVRSACASAQSHQGLGCPPADSFDTIECFNRKQMPGWDFAHARRHIVTWRSSYHLSYNAVYYKNQFYFLFFITFIIIFIRINFLYLFSFFLSLFICCFIIIIIIILILNKVLRGFFLNFWVVCQLLHVDKVLANTNHSLSFQLGHVYIKSLSLS